MKNNLYKAISAIVIISILAHISGCAGTGKKPTLTDKTSGQVKPNDTIGTLTEIFMPDVIPVEGYGIVGNLKGNGSSECPTELRNYFNQYIPKKMPGERLNIEKFLSSHNTAIVALKGLMPVSKAENVRYFDVSVEALADTQTTSLEGGWLYESELRSGGMNSSGGKVLGKVSGPVFIDPIDTGARNVKAGFVLAGGTRLEDFKININMRKPDYIVAGLIRNKLNERFGKDTAKAVSPGLIEIKIPPEYSNQKQRFLSIVRSIYIAETQDMKEKRIENLVAKLESLKEADSSEISLETIGKDCLKSLSGLLKSPKEEVRFRAARCMLNLGSDQGLYALRATALEQNNPFRIEAMEAISISANRNDATAIGRKLLRDEDKDIRIAAYNHLRSLGDPVISQKLIGRNFLFEQVTSNYKGIFASRSGQPRIAIFGGPLYCHDNIFIRSADGTITLNAEAGQKYISIIYKNPKNPNSEPIRLKSTFEVNDLIEALCEEPVKKSDDSRVGLGLTYEKMLFLLKQLVKEGAISGVGENELIIGPPAKIS